MRPFPPHRPPSPETSGPEPYRRRKRLRRRRLIATTIAVTLLASTAPAGPALAQTSTVAAGPGMLTRLANWVSDGLSDLFAETPHGHMRPGTGQLTLPGRAGAAPGKPKPPGKRVKELTGQRSARGKVFELDDGRLQAELSTVPRHYQDAKGTWREIDTHVTAVAEDGFIRGNDTTGFSSRFGNTTDKLARIKLGKRQLTLGLAGQARRIEPVVKDSTVTYPGAFGDGADLVYQVTRTGLKKWINLARPPAAGTSFEFVVKAAGLRARAEGDGSIVFVAEGGADVPTFTIPAPFMLDQTENADSPYGRSHSAAVTQTLAEREGHYVVRLTPDAAWLAATERTYPVVIDPSVRIQPEPWNATDAFINSAQPGANFDGDWRLPVGRANTTSVRRSLVTFPLEWLPSELGRVDDARLELYFDRAMGEAGAVPLEARRVTKEWDPWGVTWNAINTGFGEVAGTAVRTPGEQNRWHSFPITGLVNGWLAGSYPNYGIMLKAADESAAAPIAGPIYEAAEDLYGGGTWYGETVNIPKLVVTYGPPSVTIEEVTSSRATGATLSWSAYQDPTPDDASDDLVEYQVHRYPFADMLPNDATLLAPLPPEKRTYTDTTGGMALDDIALGDYTHEEHYMVAAKLKNGRLVPSLSVRVPLPPPGQIQKTLFASADTTLTSGQPATGHDQLDGKAWLQTGNTATTLGTTRTLLAFDDFATQIPADAQITDATLSLWGFNGSGADADFAVHRLTKPFAENATWTSSGTAGTWATPGGDYTPAAESTQSFLLADPAWTPWTVTEAAQAWIADPTSNKGLLVKVDDEAALRQSLTFLASETTGERALRPKLTVTYREPANVETAFYAPTTPPRLPASTQQEVALAVTNPTTQTWPAASTKVGYFWKLPDGTDITSPANQTLTPLTDDLLPGQTQVVKATVTAPALSPSANQAEAATLVWDVQDTLTNNWKSATHHLPQLPQQIRIDSPTSDQLGLEKFYQYTGLSTGAGSSAAVNLYAGNVTWNYSPFSNPSRGISTMARMTYNSLDTSASSMGYGWSLSASTLQRLGSQVYFHPPGQDWPSQVRLTDGDGTTHVWTLDTHGADVKTCTPATCDYTNPRGVHLYLQKTGSADPLRQWVFTKPDRTQFFYDEEGFQSAIVDKNGNTMAFTYERRKSNNKPTKFLTYITDAAGQRTLSLTYYAKGQDYTYINDAGAEVADTKLTNPHIIDNVASMTDIAGQKVTFTYSDKGLMAKMVDGAGDEQAKTFRFTYDATQGNKNVKLVEVEDPRKNTTKLKYYEAPVDSKDKWKLQEITSRTDGVTKFGYVDPDGPQGGVIHATVTDALDHATKYVLDAYGRPKSTTNAKNETVSLEWDPDHNVTKLTEPNNAYRTWTYDQKTGFPLEIKGAQANKNGWPATTLVYDTYFNGYVADLKTKTSPEGRKWAFTYDAVGNLKTVTDPAGTATETAGDYAVKYEYDALGLVSKAIDANGQETLFADYHPAGYPEKITDSYGALTTTTYDARGLVTKATDAKGKYSTVSYDIFKRPLESTVPKVQDAGVVITNPAPEYDANDNVVKTTTTNGAVITSVFDEGDGLISTVLPKDHDSDPERKVTYTYDPVGNLLKQTEPKGNLTPDNDTDFATRYVYGPTYQTDEVIDADGGKASYFYDNVGNTTKVVDPGKNATADPADYTVKNVYDLDHKQTSRIDSAGHSVAWEFDKDAKTTAVIDQEGNKTLLTLDVRGLVTESKVPHSQTSGEIKYVVTKFDYDQAGNRTRVITPRGVETTDDLDDFVQETKYDKLNRVAEQVYPYDKDDPRYNKPDSVKYTYDEVGNLTKVSAPPSSGETVRNETVSTFFDNGWTRSSTDPWDISATYEYNSTGQQINRTLHAAGGSSTRVQTWDFYPDGKLKTHADDGTPVGKDTVLVDNSDFQNVTTVGATWTPAAAGTGYQGYDYATAPAGTGEASLTWNLTIPSGGDYEVFVRYPSGATATDATYQVTHAAGTSNATVDQTKKAGEWVSLGSFSFTDAVPTGASTRSATSAQMVTLTDGANGTLTADAVKLVRDNTGEADDEKKDFAYSYDPNGNLTQITDNSSGRRIDTYDLTWTQLGQIEKVMESKSGEVKNTTSFTYNKIGNPTQRRHDGLVTDFTYDVRDMIDTVTNRRAVTDTDTTTTTFAYTPRGELLKQVAGNGNTVDLDYFLDGLARTKTEKKADGTLVASHTVGYQSNGHRASDQTKVQNADNPGAYLENQISYTYDPRDRISKVTKQVTSGDALKDETYLHDANDNVIEQTVEGVSTKFDYDRNRLMTATATGGAASTYNYDPFGRLDTITQAGQQTAKYKYDGFDHVKEYTGGSGAAAKITRYTYDPMDRTLTRTKNAGTAGEKTTAYEYLGTSDDVVSESEGGAQVKAYYYGATGQRLSQMKLISGQREHAFYSFNMRGDVEAVTAEGGNTKATYGYTAYGNDQKPLFTGADKIDPANPDQEPYNSFRYNNKRYDEASGSYDMGARDYLPGINRFLERDWFNGALSDLDLAADPWTGNRYAFAGGNPISYVEIDGHLFGLSLTDMGHLALDVVGMIPVAGEVADLANAGWYAAEGNYVDAALSLAGAIPFAGTAATAAKWVKTSVKIVTSTVVTKGAKSAAKILGTEKALSTLANARKMGGASAEAAAAKNLVANAPTPNVKTTVRKAVTTKTQVKPKDQPGAPAAKSEKSDEASGGGETRDFAHGTSATHANGILSGGLNDMSAQGATRGGQYSQPGSFFTFEIDKRNPGEALQLAYEMGLRQGDCVVLVCSLPIGVVDGIAEAGQMTTGRLPGVNILETVFHPGAFGRINASATWQLVKPGG
ncbi:DNRLRE domain-containing protein [Streptosporangium subroseum]|uniref:DNRLRE domain-containing protein n=1 Tax=Streptosporangium subroseum TaxID=106412 RepID=UPI003426B607